MSIRSALCWQGRRGWTRPVSPGRRLCAALLFTVLLAVESSQALEFTSYAQVNADGSLRVGSREVRLYGIYIPPTGQTCRTYFSPPVCGSRAALALQFRIQGFVQCEQKSVNRDRSVTALCYLDRTHFSQGEDLAAYLIRQGWALALPRAPSEYHALERIARQQSAGVWGFSVDAVTQRQR
jgi:endonuclease YncB( thermonuclease family)